MEKSTEKKYVRRSFWIHQYAKEEIFLSEMRRKGWKFVKLYKGFPTKYEFEACEPEDYCYQLDYVEKCMDNEYYHQLMKDAGWEEIMPWPALDGSWYYFGKKDAKENERLYTDQDSKYQLMNTLWKKYSVCFLLASFLEANGIRSCVSMMEHDDYTWTSIWTLIPFVSSIIFGLALLFFLYLAIAIFLEWNRLKKARKADEDKW